MLPSMFGERLFDNFFNDPFMNAFSRHDSAMSKQAGNLMKTDVRELENAYELDIELPGFKKNEVSIELDKGYLIINAARTANKTSPAAALSSTSARTLRSPRRKRWLRP